MDDIFFDDLTDWMTDAEPAEVAAIKKEASDAKDFLCPYCGRYLAPSEIYVNIEGNRFCRRCFIDGKGAQQIDEPTKEAFAFEYELPPDDEFDQEKLASFTARGYQVQNPATLTNSRSIAESRLKNYRAGVIGSSEPYEISLENLKLPAALLTPLLGAGAGYLSTTPEDEDAGDTKAKRSLRGLLSGLGAVGGATLGSKLTGGDFGSGIVGGAAGGTLAYLLSKGLTNIMD